MSSRWNSSAGIIDFWKVYKSKHLCTLKKLEATVVVSKPVLCVWNPCQNQLKYWWNLYFSNFVHWKMVYAVAALQDLQILQRSKICAHFSDLTKRIQNQCHWYVYIHVYVCDLNKRNMRKFYDAFQRVHLGSKVWNKLQSARKRCGKVEIRVSRQVGVRIDRLSKSTNQVDCWKYEIWMVEQICSWARLHGQRRSHICLNPKRYRKQGSGGHSCTQWGYMLQKVMYISKVKRMPDLHVWK